MRMNGMKVDDHEIRNPESPRVSKSLLKLLHIQMRWCVAAISKLHSINSTRILTNFYFKVGILNAN
jgi:hypothetical protein